jgi:hypothetical protein
VLPASLRTQKKTKKQTAETRKTNKQKRVLNRKSEEFDNRTRKERRRKQASVGGRLNNNEAENDKGETETHTHKKKKKEMIQLKSEDR